MTEDIIQIRFSLSFLPPLPLAGKRDMQHTLLQHERYQTLHLL